MAQSEVIFSGQERTVTVQDFGQIVQKYQDRIFNTVLRLVANHEDALDITQEVFLKAYRALRGFRGSASVYTWLYRIAVNTALSHRSNPAGRLLHFSQSPRSEESDIVRELENPAPGTSELADRKEMQEKIQEAILALEGDLRSVVVLRDVEGLCYDEIAKILRLPAGTVKSRLHRGRLILRDKLLAFIQAEGKK